MHSKGTKYTTTTGSIKPGGIPKNDLLYTAQRKQKAMVKFLWLGM